MSSSLFSGPWAAILAEAVVAHDLDTADPAALAGWLQERRQAWAGRIDTSGLAWFQRPKLPTGAFSTLLWVRVQPDEQARPGSFGGYRLTGHAIGDSCLFHVRGGELVRSFPQKESAEFQADPLVLGSVDLKRDHLLRFATLDEVCYPDDLLILCTDALAEWALRSYETGDLPAWDDFWRMPEDEWRSGILWLRQQGQIRIDDTTMVLLVVAEPAEQPAAAEPGVEADAALGWIRSASKEVRPVSARVADEADQASERMVQGFKSLKQKALRMYREKFGKRPEPPKKE